MMSSRSPLFDPRRFHDACGTGFIAEVSGRPSRRVVTLALGALRRLTHRGARSADRRSGDGAGLLTDIPLPFFERHCASALDYRLPDDRLLAVAMVFTSAEEDEQLLHEFRTAASAAGMHWIGVREVPVYHEVLGETARASCPRIVQYLIACPRDGERTVEQRLFLLRKRVERRITETAATSFICSLSSRTVVYKGQLTAAQLERFYDDLRQPDFVARVALFHERFSTNTSPSWSMAQPFRMLAHNGEINTVKGNRLWMQAREGEIRSQLWGDELGELTPIVSAEGSDSFSLDNALEFLRRSGRTCCQSAMMLVPDPYQHDPRMLPALRDFYLANENRIEPWDGPAALVFTDGEIVGAKLDRNGLRPLRSAITRDGLVVVASEAGVVDLDDDELVQHHHLTSGEVFAVKLDGSGILDDEQIKVAVAGSAPYGELLADKLETIERGDAREQFGSFALPESGFDRRLRHALGWSEEDLTRFVIPMAESGREPLGSMGDDTPPAVLTDRGRRFYDYLVQCFAQVTNPPIDPIREREMTSLRKSLGAEDGLLESESHLRRAIRIESPVLSPRELQTLLEHHERLPHRRLSTHLRVEGSFEECLERLGARAEQAAREGIRLILLTDENLRRELVPIPMALAVSAVHQHLVRTRLRTSVSLICLSGDVVEDHHVACLVGLGASAVYPYMAYELIRERFADDDDWPERMASYRWALEKGLLKIMAKMGISTVSSYHGSMLFHGLGLSASLLERYFPSIECCGGGIGLERIRRDLIERNDRAFAADGGELRDEGRYRYRKRGEPHGFAPPAFKRIQRLARGDSVEAAQRARPVHLRDLLTIVGGQPVPLDSVEAVEEIHGRFGAGAISFGAIADEAHRALARGMNLIGARSSSGEGGEPADRYAPGNPDRSANCRIKQIASGRFGVTADYLAAAGELQIKMAQGAKPGEGGQLPGHKVTVEIAAARSSTAGVPLISPPPHHDIYSIEDLAQLIHDLKQVNPRCAVSVKLVSQPGVGTVACGVVKAGADVVLISGGDGGTGATPLGSMKHCGLPWELGLAEAHRCLTFNGLRNRVSLRVDGGLQTGHDVIVAALLGAEEFDFGTALLVALGCVMARQCHLNTCPVGIATQDLELRGRFRGKPEQVAAYLASVAEECRVLLSRMGMHTLEDAIGRSDLLAVRAEHEPLIEERGLDLGAIINPAAPDGLPIETTIKYPPSPARARPSLDERIIEQVRPAMMAHGQAVVQEKVRNTDRAVGARLAGEIAFLFGRGNFHGDIQCRLQGVAGQSFGAFLVDGLELRLRGVANDYVGKGMSGGLVTIRLPKRLREQRKSQTIIGNVALYGATGGTMFVAGRAGERFAVRNSGAAAVVEGVSNHCCEYMTRGTVVVIGEFGRNFGAGMTGGVAYVHCTSDRSLERLNTDFVRADATSEADEGLIVRLLRNHLFHTGSLVAAALLEDWTVERFRMKKIVPLATEIVDFKEVYDQHVAARMGVLLNE